MGSALINRLSNWMPLLFAHKWIIKWTKKTSERRSIRQSISESVEGRMVDVTSTEHKSWFHIHSEPGLETSPRNVPQMFVGLWALEAPPMSDWQTLSFFFHSEFFSGMASGQMLLRSWSLMWRRSTSRINSAFRVLLFSTRETSQYNCVKLHESKIIYAKHYQNPAIMYLYRLCSERSQGELELTGADMSERRISSGQVVRSSTNTNCLNSFLPTVSSGITFSW